MKPRTLLMIGLVSLGSSALAQSIPEPAPPAAPPSPRALIAPAPLAPARPVVAPVAVAPPAPPAPMASAAPQKPPAAPRPAIAPAPAPAPPAPAPPQPPGQMINARIDVTLSDSKGAPKVLTMTVADGESGMNRTTAVGFPGGPTNFSFNADAQPSIVGNRIRLRLTADAVVPIEGEKAPDGSAPRLGLRQTQTVILNDGESVEIARATDPTSDRSFALTVKVTILR